MLQQIIAWATGCKHIIVPIHKISSTCKNLIWTHTHRYKHTFAASPSPNSLRSQCTGSYMGELHWNEFIWTKMDKWKIHTCNQHCVNAGRCKLGSAPPSLKGRCVTILNRVMAHTNIYRKIRERTRDNNESSWVAAEDGLYSYHTKLYKPTTRYSKEIHTNYLK